MSRVGNELISFLKAVPEPHKSQTVSTKPGLHMFTAIPEYVLNITLHYHCGRALQVLCFSASSLNVCSSRGFLEAAELALELATDREPGRLRVPRTAAAATPGQHFRENVYPDLHGYRFKSCKYISLGNIGVYFLPSRVRAMLTLWGQCCHVHFVENLCSRYKSFSN